MTHRLYLLADVADAKLTITTSVAAISVFVRVNDANVPVVVVVLKRVIFPVGLLSVTPVVRLVACVTVPPAPVP